MLSSISLFRYLFILILININVKLIQTQNFQNVIDSELFKNINNNYINRSTNNIFKIINQFNIENFLNASTNVNNYYRSLLTGIDNNQCDKEMLLFQNGITNFETWALEMIDAASKIPSGILMGNLKDIGTYDECVSIKVDKDNATIMGRHCMYTVSLFATGKNPTLSLTLSICLPASCGTDKVNDTLHELIQLIKDNVMPINMTISSITCSGLTDESVQTGEIVFISVLASFILILVIATVCDILLRSRLIRKSNGLQKFSQFSFYTNILKVMDTSPQPSSISAIAGVRFLSISWVMLGHTYFIYLLGLVSNPKDFYGWAQSWGALYIIVAPFAVDTFFVMSGLLTAYLFLKEMAKGRKFNILLYYIHRYIRLTPAFAILMLLVIYILPKMGSGALWEGTMYVQRDVCRRQWWRMLLYIHNYGETDVLICLGHSWYLAVDMQFYWLSPLILYPLAKKPKLGFAILGTLMIASVIVPDVISAIYKYPGGIISKPALDQGAKIMTDLYIPSHTRMAPWLLGVFFGYKLATERRTLSMNLNLIRVGWLFAILSLAFSVFTYRVYQNFSYEFDIYWEMFYISVFRYVWAFAVCWIIYSSTLGYGGIVKQFLSLPIFLPLSRLSYCIYLLHFVIQTMKSSATRGPAYFSDFQAVNSFFSDLVLTVMVALMYSVLFESPFLILEKMIMPKPKIVLRSEPIIPVSNGIDNNAYENDNYHNQRT